MSLEKKQIARQFSRAAASYDEVAQLQIRMAHRLIEQIPIQATGTLVDLGCGTGQALARIADKTELKLIGVDLATGMIEQATQRLQSNPGIMLLVTDLAETGLPANSVDWVFSNAAIQWSDSRIALAEMKRILKPGGQLLVSTFGPQTLHQWKTAWQAIDDPYPRVHRFDSDVELTAHLEAVGFEASQVSTHCETSRFGSVDEMFASVKQLGATNASRQRAPGLLGRAKYQRLRDYFECVLLDQGHLPLTFECLFVSAQQSP